MTSTTIPVAAFEYRANNAQALAKTSELRGAMEGLTNIPLAKLDSGFANLGATIARFVPALTAVGIGRFALSAVQAADAMGDAAERAGLSVETFSRLQHVAKQSDVEFSQLTNSIRQYQDGLSNAISGTGAMRGALGLLNLNARELGRLPLEEQLGKIADAFKNNVAQVDRTRVAVDLFGRGGQALIPLLNRGSAGIRELTAEADRLGITLDTRAVKAIDRGTKALERWTTAAKHATASAIGNFLADIFGTGDELADLEERYGGLERQLKSLQSYADRFPGNAAAGGTNARIAGLTAALAELQPRLQVLRDLNALERGESISGGPSRRRIDPVTEFQVTLKKISEDEEDFSSIMRRISESRLKEQNELANMFADGQQDVRNDAVRAEEEAQKEITAITVEQLKTRAEAAKNVRDYERDQEESLQAQLLNIRQQGALAAQTLLTAYSGRFAGIARGILIIEKSMAIKSIFMDTQAAMMKVIKQYGAPWGYALAAGVAIYGAARVAAVASTVAGGDNAPAIGSPHNPVYTAPGSTDETTSGSSASDQGGQRIIQLIVNGNVYSGRESVDFFIQSLQDRINEYDTVIINPTSRQARELIPEPT